MNTELKSLINLVLDGLTIEQDAANGKNIVLMIPDLFAAMSDLPGAVSNFADLQNEIKALAGSAQEADLIAYIESKFGGVVSNSKAQAILAAALQMIEHLVQDVLGLQQSIKG